MSVYFEINGGLLKNIVKAIENLNEECIFSFDSKGFYIQLSDVYKYKMLELFISSEDLESYECDEMADLGFIIDRVKDVSKTLKVRDSLIFSYKGGANIVLKANGISRSIKLIDTDIIGRVPSLALAEKDLSNGYSANIDSSSLNTFLKAASNAISFDVKTEDGNLNISSSTDEGLIEVGWEDIQLTPSNYGSNTNYSIAEVSKAVSIMDGLTRIRGCQDGLIEFKWKMGNESYARAMIAARV